MKQVTLAALALLILFLTVQRATSQVQDDKVIVPGVRIGKWALDMTVEDLVRMNGPGLLATVEPRVGAASLFPTAAADVRENMGIRIWPELGLGAAHRGGTQVEYLSIGIFGSGANFSVISSFKTAQGIAWGARPDRVEAAYGLPSARTRASNVRERLIYDEIGIAFVFLSTSSGPPGANELTVFRPGTAKAIWKF